MTRRLRRLVIFCCVVLPAISGCTRRDPVIEPDSPSVTIRDPDSAVAHTREQHTEPESPKRNFQPLPATAPMAPVAGTPASGGSFEFPKDSGGEQLKKLLTPRDGPRSPADERSPMRGRTLPDSVGSPGPRLPDSSKVPVRLPERGLPTPLPTSLPERIPVRFAPELPTLPAMAPQPIAPRIKGSPYDADRRTEVPIFSNRVPDRPPLTDPTVEFSAGSVISVKLPLREQPSGFIRFNLPDPFEHSESNRSLPILPVDPKRSLGNPPPPRK